MTERITRRYVLFGAIAFTTTIAGCSSRDESLKVESPGGPSTAAGGPFSRVAMNGTALVVELISEADVEQVNVIAPDGSRVASEGIVTGQTRVTVDIGTAYVPGHYQITTESGASVALTVKPDLSIEELGVGANNPDVMPDSLDNFKPYAATVVLQNSGSGPTAVDNLAIVGDVPTSTDDIISTPETSGIVDPETGSGELDRVLVPPNASVRIFSSTLPFLFTGQPQSCDSMPDDATVTVRVTSTVTEQPTERRFDAEYDADEDECIITISTG